MVGEKDGGLRGIWQPFSWQRSIWQPFVDKEWQDLMVDVEEIFESLLSFKQFGDVLLGAFLTSKYSCEECDSI